jgi:5-methylcytosine-specific restriction endonuclease McrA
MLDSPTLVLNKLWVPIDVTSVRRAMVWLFRDVARVVEPESYQVHDFTSWADLRVTGDGPAIHTVDRAIRIPEVVLLTTYTKVPDGYVVFSRRNLFKRDANQCQYCGRKPGTSELTIDHVLPRSRGGMSTWENCVLACVDCNRRKGDKLLRDFHLRLLREPKRPKWSPLGLGRSTRYHRSWEKFVADAYWNVELEQ